MKSTMQQQQHHRGRSVSPMAYHYRLAAMVLVVILVEIAQKFSVFRYMLLQQSQSLQHRESSLTQLWSPVTIATTTKMTTISVTSTPQKREMQGNHQSLLFAGTNETNNNNNKSSNNEIICNSPPGQGIEGREGLQALYKVQVEDYNASNPSAPGILCIVMTDNTHHHAELQAIVDTYAPKCDGFLAVSDVADVHLGAVGLFNSTTSQDNDWEKVLRVWNYVYSNYVSNNNNNNHRDGKYDYFYLTGDDTYLIPQNLKAMLSEYKTPQSEPLYIGGAVVASRLHPDVRHCGGGAGYVFNKAALSLFVNQLQMEDQCANIIFSSSQGEQRIRPADQQMAKCFALQNIQCHNTFDKNFAGRFHEFGINYQATWSKAVTGPIKAKPLKQYHGIYMKAGVAGISKSSVSFHLVNGREPITTIPTDEAIRRVHAILYGTCDEIWDRPLGALDSFGSPNYVHDPTYLRNNPIPFDAPSSVCNIPFGSSIEGDSGYRGLKKIKIMSPSQQQAGELAPPKVMCIIYTHSGRHDRVKATAETYGSKCDGFMAASNATDPTIGAVNLLHEGPEAYGNMWLKVRSIWQYVHLHYSDQFDYFHIGGDDHYVIPENLRYMVATSNWNKNASSTTPLYLGGAMIDFPRTHLRYCGGGAGYTLNKAALSLLVQDLFHTHSCRPHHEASDEDRIIANCFRSAGILCSDTHDDNHETRYHAADVNYHANWNQSIPSVWRAEPLEKFHGIKSKEGLGQISETSVSFHLKTDDETFSDSGIRRYHAILYDMCDKQ